MTETKIEFTIKIENEEDKEVISFQQIIDENDNITDGYSFNPISGWTNYKSWDVGWSEQKEELNEWLRAIHDFSESQKLYETLCTLTHENVGDQLNVTYFCDGQVHENKEYNFVLIIEDIEELE